MQGYDLTNMDFTEPQPQAELSHPQPHPLSSKEVVIDEIVFIAEANDPLNETILARLTDGDMFLEDAESDSEEEDFS